MEQLVFGWIDYFLFISLLGLSLLIGIYFGFFSKQNSVNEYLFGGKSMGYLPVATSILASLLSGITFLGVPTEVYLYGCHYFLTIFNTVATGILTAYVFIPVFYNLQISSTFEYLQLRFSRSIRRFASFLYILSLSMHLPIVIYVPALAFSQVSGYNLHLITPLLCIVCITYTSMGGVKAVVWTDTIQFVFTVGGLCTILMVGICSVGDFFDIWKISKEGGRLDIFNFDPSPFVRNTFWGMTVGTTFSSVSHSAIGQKFIQRYLAIKTQADINKAILFKTVGTITIDIMCTFAGLTIYAYYYNCDPMSAKLITRNDQIVPYYVMDITKNLPGLAGIFLAGVISSALSTMSAGINTLAGIIYDDFVDQWMPDCPNKDSRAANIMKVISVFVGLISIALIFVIEHMGTVLEMSYSFRGAADGPLLGIFLLGMMFPCVGKKGAITGACISLSIMLWIVVGSKWHLMHNSFEDSKLAMSVENCSFILNQTVTESTPSTPSPPKSEPLIFFQLTFLYYCLTGTFITVVVGIITSYVIGETDTSKVNPDHLTPSIRRFLPKKYVTVPLNEIAEEEKKSQVDTSVSGQCGN